MTYRLEPCATHYTSFRCCRRLGLIDRPIDVFVTYDGKRAADITVSRYAVRHLVAGEVSGMEGFFILCRPTHEADRSMP